VEYAKDGPSDILCQYTITNRGPEAVDLHVIPSLWFRCVSSKNYEKPSSTDS
jgi:hypothetical protein